jgi:hypothetical protein
MKTCYWCAEPIEDSEMWALVGDKVAHENCNLRSVLGSVAHIEKRCSCFVPGSTEGDPEGMTRREAANAAKRAFEWVKFYEELM